MSRRYVSRTCPITWRSVSSCSSSRRCRAQAVVMVRVKEVVDRICRSAGIADLYGGYTAKLGLYAQVTGVALRCRRVALCRHRMRIGRLRVSTVLTAWCRKDSTASLFA